VRSIAIIGGHADVGVLSGGGSAQVYPIGGSAVPNEGPAFFPGPIVYHRSSPMGELAKLTKAKLTYNDGKDRRRRQAGCQQRRGDRVRQPVDGRELRRR
jgi:beta-glucosidase